MCEPESFTSLMALVEDHLSKVSMQANSSDNDNRFPKFILPSLSGSDAMPSSFPGLPGQRLPLPTLTTPDSSIQEVLAMQLNNMFIAKEKKKQEELKLAEERQKLADRMAELKATEEDNDVIDLSHAVIDYSNIEESLLYTKAQLQSNSSSRESLFEPAFVDCDNQEGKFKIPEPPLPCIEDMSFILNRKVKRGRMSAFGKVLTSRLRPVAAPYLMENTESSIERFDFSTKSPCDLYKERLRKPSTSAQTKFQLFDIFPDLEIEFKKADMEFDEKK